MIKRILCCFSVVLALSAPVARVYADPTMEEYTLNTISNALYQYKYGEYIPVLLPPNYMPASWDDITIWEILYFIYLNSNDMNGYGSLYGSTLRNLLEEYGYGEFSYDNDQFEFYDGKSMSEALKDGEFMRELVNTITESQLNDLLLPQSEMYGFGNLFPLYMSAIASLGGGGGGGGGGGEFPTQVKIDIKNILENSITNNVAVSNILDVLTNPNSRQPNVLNISLTNISHYASNTVDVATQIRDILKEILENQTNHNDGLDTSINWMTNNWPDAMVAPPGGGGDSSNDVWSVWIPGSWSTETEFYRVPSIQWELVSDDGYDFWKPMYRGPLYQPDNFYQTYQSELMTLLQDYRTNGIDGQQFVSGLLFLQSRMMGQVSTQLYMLHEKIGITKTNLWDSINEETNWVRDNAESVKSEVEGQQYQVENLLNRADTSIISTYFPKVQTAISRLNTTSNDPVVRVPLPSVFGSGSGSAVWTIDVREIQGHDALRKFCRWVCIIVWSIIFVRTFIVPSLVVLCLCARFSDMACGLLFVDSLDGCHVIGETVGGLSEFVLNLVGLDTNLKRWAVGVSTI